MRVKELKDILNVLPDDLDIVLASDEEGNNFENLSDVETHYVEKFDDHYDLIMSEDEISEEDPDDVDLLFKKIVVLWP